MTVGRIFYIYPPYIYQPLAYILLVFVFFTSIYVLKALAPQFDIPK